MLPLTADTLEGQASPALIEQAVLRTLAYADVFGCPLTGAEIHRYLEQVAATPAELQGVLDNSDWLAGRLSREGPWYALRGREGLAAARDEQTARAGRLWQTAWSCGRLLACLPFVRMVAVTGALAVDNVKTGDDIDFMIVTAPGRVWLVRAAAIVVVRLARLAGVQLCPNYVLAETALSQDRRDLFVAHELAQMVPLSGLPLYWRMRAANVWAEKFLPNALSLPQRARDLGPGQLGRRCQRLLERLLSGRWVDWLEAWERGRKTRRFKSQMAAPGSAARLDAERVQGHFNDYGSSALAEYHQRCEKLLKGMSALTAAAEL